MIQVRTRPERPQVNNAALYSYWNCASLPFLFQLQRRDVELISTNAGVSALVVRAVYSSAITSGLVVGDQIFVASGTVQPDGSLSNYNVVGTITAINTDGATYINYYTDIAIEVSSTSGGYLNIVKRTNYYAAITGYITNPVTGKTDIIMQRLTPDKYGFMRLDMSGYLSSCIDRSILPSYSVVNKKSIGAYGSFYFSHAERWTGNSGSEVVDPITYHFADSVKQIKDQYGQNLCDYVPFGTSFTPAAKFLTRFEKPTYFPGYPFCLSFIYPGELSIMQIVCKEDEFTKSGAAISTVNRTIEKSQRKAVNRLTLSGTGYSSGTAQLDVYLRANAFLQEGYYSEGYANDGYTELDPPSIGALTPYDLTEKKRVKIGVPCGKNPVYLRWRNQLGGWDYWLFESNQMISQGSQIDGEFNQSIDDLADISYKSSVIKIMTQDKISCGGTLPLEDFQGVKGIEKSPDVYLLTSTVAPYDWIRVKIIPKGFAYQTKGSTADVSVEFTLPEEYTLSN